MSPKHKNYTIKTMKKFDNSGRYNELRKSHPFISYESHSFSVNNNAIDITFYFNLSGKHSFSPTLNIPLRDFYNTEILSAEKLESMVFSIGMVEIISYWKAACPPQIIVKQYSLNEEQKLWWEKLYYYGLGEFFYLNSIHADIDDFVEIICEGEKTVRKESFNLDNSYIVPVGGGKDSAVTIELLKDAGVEIAPFIMNPRGASLDTIKTAGFSTENIIIVNRKIDPLLIKLNENDYLNGHTPFSALLAFITVFMAAVSGKRNIALSNEASANESTITGKKINHQYSKSFEFENDFRNYISKYISDNINYFSILRPLHEIQIAKLFSRHEKYFDVFKSCNAGSKTDIWCGKCAKCLFVYIILSPFVRKDKLIAIFGKNLLDDKELLHFFKQLTGEDNIKPFECIGTIDEVNLALRITVSQYETELPFLLNYYKNSALYHKYSEVAYDKSLKSLESEHFINKQLVEFLQKKLYE